MFLAINIIFIVTIIYSAYFLISISTLMKMTKGYRINPMKKFSSIWNRVSELHDKTLSIKSEATKNYVISLCIGRIFDLLEIEDRRHFNEVEGVKLDKSGKLEISILRDSVKSWNVCLFDKNNVENDWRMFYRILLPVKLIFKKIDWQNITMQHLKKVEQKALEKMKDFTSLEDVFDYIDRLEAIEEKRD